MELATTDEQRLLRDALNRLVASHYGPRHRRAIVATTPGWCGDLWARMAGLGVLGLPFEAAHGGMSGNALDLAVVMQALGRGLAAEPYLSTVVLAGGVVRRAGTEDQKRRFIPGIVRGKAHFAFAFAERTGRYNLADVGVTAEAVGSGFRLNGEKIAVYGAPWADGHFITARTAGGRRDRSGIGLFFVSANAPGLEMRPYRTVDGAHAATLTFRSVDVRSDDVLGDPDTALAAVEQVVDEATAAVCAEAAGAVSVVNEQTLDYARTRKTFGQTLKDFQVIRHRLVDMRVAEEYVAAMAQMAALRLHGSPSARARAVSAAKAQVGKDSRFVAQAALQLHGAIGITDELELGQYFKRLTMIGLLFGGVDHHVRRYAGLTR